MSLLEQLIRYVNRGKCERLFNYQGRSFEFKGVTAEVYGAKINLGEFKSEIKNFESIAEAARALDDFHFHYCNDLTNSMLKENLTKEDLRVYTKMLLGAQACMLNFRLTLEAFKTGQDPQNQAANLDKSIQMMGNYVTSVTPGFVTDEGRKALSDALSSVNLNEKDIDDAISDQR
jgi:hypothetical protein